MIYCIGAYRSDGTLDSMKVGHTDGDMATRLYTLQCGNALELRTIGTAPGGPMAEGAVQEALRRHLIRGEWYRPDPDVVAYFKRGVLPPHDPAIRDSSFHGYLGSSLLAQELDVRGVTQESLAKFLEVTPSTVCHYLKRLSFKPRRAHRIAIERWSEGRIPVGSWDQPASISEAAQ